MHEATPRIGIQTTIFSEHEVFQDCCHFLNTLILIPDILQKNVKIMKKL